jgi:hypothetical protein
VVGQSAMSWSKSIFFAIFYELSTSFAIKKILTAKFPRIAKRAK